MEPDSGLVDAAVPWAKQIPVGKMDAAIQGSEAGRKCHDAAVAYGSTHAAGLHASDHGHAATNGLAATEVAEPADPRRVYVLPGEEE